ncbi:MAG: ATP-binding cassette domain-containing protein [Gammaproteobacteria bacterium]|nr:MAG: ATP-binding cassette domain-containing protein [Gammaproteobacteria bacterium]
MNAPLLNAASLSKTFQIKDRLIRAVNKVSFQLSAGETLAIVGDTGSGKSTLARIITGLVRPDEGQILLNSKDIFSYPIGLLRQKIRYIAQDPRSSFSPAVPVGETLRLPLIHLLKLNANQANERVKDALQQVGLDQEVAHFYPHMLSGGQIQRLAIARALLTKPDIVVADEPLSALDVSIQAQILNLLLKLQRETNVSFLIVSHNLQTVYQIAHKVLVMYQGVVVEQGAVDAVFAHPVHPYTRFILELATRPDIEQSQWRRHSPVMAANPDTASENACVYVNCCPIATPKCGAERPREMHLDQQWVHCHYAQELENDLVNPDQ